jgi:hypothetical protein
MTELTKCSVSYEPFTSIDIECTGLEPDIDTLLEFGAAFYDGVHKDPVETLNILIIPDGAGTDVNYRLSGQPIALSMNKEILDEITDTLRKYDKDLVYKEAIQNDEYPAPMKTAKGQLLLEESVAMNHIWNWLDHLVQTHRLKKKHVFCGKNLNALDIPFLKYRWGKEAYDKVAGFRSLDLTSVFAPFSRKTSPLKDINALRGLGQVSHRALQDAIETGGAVIDIYEKNLQW